MDGRDETGRGSVRGAAGGRRRDWEEITSKEEGGPEDENPQGEGKNGLPVPNRWRSLGRVGRDELAGERVVLETKVRDVD
jgi:hypothetical protein